MEETIQVKAQRHEKPVEGRRPTGRSKKIPTRTDVTMAINEDGFSVRETRGRHVS